MKEDLIITDHAYKRAKERFRWKRSSLDRTAREAFKNGITHKDTKGSLNRFITKLWKEYENCGNIRIYGEVIYFFKGSLLITLYQIPNKYKKYVSKL